MNTGVAYMSTATLQRLNSEGEVLYSEDFSILDTFGEVQGLTSEAFSLLSIEDAQLRYNQFSDWLSSLVNSESKPFSMETPIKVDHGSCPLPSSNWETGMVVVESTNLETKGNGEAVLKTSFDKVGTINEDHYLLEFDLMKSTSLKNSIDYTLAKEGELIYKSQVPRKDLVFDINEAGELIVIGKDADHYLLNENGELCYKY